jgi:regulator of protease activity HflC (stomatin/prohibitin superfamily)
MLQIRWQTIQSRIVILARPMRRFPGSIPNHVGNNGVLHSPSALVQTRPRPEGLILPCYCDGVCGTLLSARVVLEYFVIVVLLMLAGLGVWLWKNLTSTTVFEYQKGLLFKDGKLSRELDAGHYRYLSKRSTIEVFDLRRRALDLIGQEILTKDNVSIRLSVVGQIQVTEPMKVLQQSESYMAEVYALTQLALRDAVSTMTLDELLVNRTALDQLIQSNVTERANDMGLSITNLAVRDIMLPPNLKKAYAGVLEAQKNAQVNLEKARGEQAVLRSLANSSKLYAENPSLLQARVIQALSTGKNTIVFGADDQISIGKK